MPPVDLAIRVIDCKNLVNEYIQWHPLKTEIPVLVLQFNTAWLIAPISLPFVKNKSVIFLGIQDLSGYASRKDEAASVAATRHYSAANGEISSLGYMWHDWVSHQCVAI